MAVLLALILAVYGVLPQIHLAWGHAHHETACPGPACSTGKVLAAAAVPDDPESPDCPICHDFQAAPCLVLPAPPPQVGGSLVCYRELPGPAAVVRPGAGIVRGCWARGPPLG